MSKRQKLSIGNKKMKSTITNNPKLEKLMKKYII